MNGFEKWINNHVSDEQLLAWRGKLTAAVIALTPYNMFKGALITGAVVTSFGEYGPLDVTRTVYNAATLNGPVLKRDLLDYSRQGLQDCNVIPIPELEERLAQALDVPYTGEPIDPTHVDTADLWELAETLSGERGMEYLWTDLSGKAGCPDHN